ncbi:MAG: hypothetical protein PHV20_07860 [Bacteroidales bacterium]|nr:hypothetical protein [Bacteroidales bacterium]
MKRTKLIAMLLHVLVFMSFILPFQRCNIPRMAECAAPTADSIIVSETNPDSIKQEVKADSVVNNNKLSKAVKKISLYDSIVSFIFFDKELNYTGFAMITAGISSYKTDFGFLNAFVLLIIGFFILRFRKKDSSKLVLIIDSLGLIFLLIAKGDMWGYWVCVGLWTVMVLFDGLLVYKSKTAVS